MSIIDFQNLPPQNEMVAVVADMNLDDTLMNLNVARQLTLGMKDEEEITEAQGKMAILLARRLRELRATSRAKKSSKAKAAAKPDVPLGDLLNNI